MRYFLLQILASFVFSIGQTFCGQCDNGGAPPMDNVVMNIACSDVGATISTVLFASYGTPSGVCPTFSKGSCNAANSSIVVQDACVGQHSCNVYPNTTTYGDPCFGTAKTLAVALACSSGQGSATCGVAPSPPAPTLPNFTATVTVDWSRKTAVVHAEPSLQVVSQHFLFRDSPVAEQAWASLSAVAPRRVRWVPWLPYAQYGVGELMPPSVGHVCGPQNWAAGGQSLPITLDCGQAGGVIAGIDFASFGTPTGSCGAYAASSCHAANSSAVVAALCVGKQSCVLPTEAGGAFGRPCAGATWLAVQARCTNSDSVVTYWNLTLPDQFLSDFWTAVDGDHSNPIPNFSTQPTWLYSPTDYSWNENRNQPWDYSGRGSADGVNTTLLGEYYGRLYGYFNTGAMVDEAGATHVRPGGALNITNIEVFNEVDYEHGYDPVTYTASFDAVVRGVRAAADPGKSIAFVGLSLPNIDGADKVVTWATYFLNASNHAPDAVDALNYIGYHAYPTGGGYTPDPTSFARMFDYVDNFIAGVLRVDGVIAQQSPTTRTVLDETGTDMDNVLGGGHPPDNNPRYWVAAAGYFAYMFARAANESATVVQVGASQLMDAPGQEPSVTLLDWASGKGTARLWIVKLLIDSVALGDVIAATTATASGADSADAAFAMAFSRADGSQRILLINKRNAWVSVSATCGAAAPCACVSVAVLDEFSGLEPAREVACPEAGQVLSLAPYAIAVLRVA